MGAREEVLCVDWRIHSVVSVHVPRDVDQQGRVRREWPKHCPQKVLLSYWRTQEGLVTKITLRIPNPYIREAKLKDTSIIFVVGRASLTNREAAGPFWSLQT